VLLTVAVGKYMKKSVRGGIMNGTVKVGKWKRCQRYGASCISTF